MIITKVPLSTWPGTPGVIRSLTRQEHRRIVDALAMCSAKDYALIHRHGCSKHGCGRRCVALRPGASA